MRRHRLKHSWERRVHNYRKDDKEDEFNTYYIENLLHFTLSFFNLNETFSALIYVDGQHKIILMNIISLQNRI